MKSPLLAFCFAKQRQKIKFLLQNRLASPRRGRAKPFFFQLAEGVGLEPTKPARAPVFETGAIDRYATLPDNQHAYLFQPHFYDVHPAGVEPTVFSSAN